jgi:hypothetical protein
MATKDRGMYDSSEPAPISEGNKHVSAILHQLRPLNCICCTYIIMSSKQLGSIEYVLFDMDGLLSRSLLS